MKLLVIPHGRWCQGPDTCSQRKRLAKAYSRLLMTFLPLTVSCPCQYCPDFIEHISRKCNIPWSPWHYLYPACHSLRTGHMVLRKCITRAQSSHHVPGFCSLINLSKNYPSMCPAWASQGLDHSLILFISCSLMNSTWWHIWTQHTVLTWEVLGERACSRILKWPQGHWEQTDCVLVIRMSEFWTWKGR